MKPSEFRKFYLTFVELYGAIYSDDAYEIMKRFFPKLLKKEMYADMKSRVDKMTRGYLIRRTDTRKYVVCSEWHDDDDLDEIFQQHANIPFYVVDDLEEYWKIGKFGVELPGSAEELTECLSESCNITRADALTRTTIIGHIIRDTYYTEIPDEILHYISLWDPPISGIDKLEEVLDRILELTNTIRLPAYCGHSLRELDEMHIQNPHLENTEERVPEIADALQDLLLEEDVDEEELIRQLKESDALPEYAKESLIKALEEIAEQKKNLPKA